MIQPSRRRERISARTVREGIPSLRARSAIEMALFCPVGILERKSSLVLSVNRFPSIQIVDKPLLIDKDFVSAPNMNDFPGDTKLAETIIAESGQMGHFADCPHGRDILIHAFHAPIYESGRQSVPAPPPGVQPGVFCKGYIRRVLKCLPTAIVSGRR